MPLNTDPAALADEDYFTELQEHADRVGDAGLHTSAERWLIENTDYSPEVGDGQDR